MGGCGSDISADSYGAFLYTLRNPIERMVSWFYYEKKLPHTTRLRGDKSTCRQRLYKYLNDTGCFETIEEFASNLIPPSSDQDTAKDADLDKRNPC